jgi:hypothetical protein
MIEPLESRRLLSATISGTVFNDLNASGTVNAGEKGLANETVYVDLNFDGMFDQGDASVLTDTHGDYDFTVQNAGVYRVSIVVPSGFRQTDPAKNFYDVIVTGFGDIHSGENFGITSTGIIRGNVYDDLNANQTKDITEQGISGIVVFIDKNKNGKLDKGETSVKTDANGNYRLSALAAGSYVIRVAAPKGLTSTTPGVLHITVHSGQSLSNRNFGLV